MKKYFLTIAILSLGFWAHAISFGGASHQPVRVSVPASTGLDAVFVAYTTDGLTISYTTSSAGSQVKWSKYSNLGGAYAQELIPTKNGSTYSISAESGDMGYLIEEGTSHYYFWLTDYAAHRLELGKLGIAPDQDCGVTTLSFEGKADEIPYYNINGRRMVLSRELELDYNQLTFDSESFSYRLTQAHETLESASSNIRLGAVYASTAFTLSGDRFLKAWGEDKSILSPTYTPTTVDANTRATQASREIDNEQTEAAVTDGLGGSAPCEISFEAAVTDAALFTEWQISRSPEFGITENTFNDLAFTYVFTEQGTSYVRFVANNADGTCEWTGDTYQVFIGESRLDIPNAFSPDASPGVNDEWKVSYKSLVSYHCDIFNRWGTLLFSSSDPSQGWDGRHKGKYVPAGVYFYVIKATGADGIKYDKAGDINIIKYKQGNTTETTE